MRLVIYIKRYFKNLGRRLLDSNESIRIIHLYTYLTLGVISFIMTIINLITSERYLGFATLIMGVCCSSNFAFQIVNKKPSKIIAFFFGIEITLLCTFFVVYGYPAGFSIIWLTLIPPIAVLFYGIRGGIILSATQLVILIFFLWVPAGQNLIHIEAIYSIAHTNICTSDIKYGEAFRLRFPVLYLGDLALAILLEIIKSIAYNEIEKINRKNDFLSKHDNLTKLNNRAGLMEFIENAKKLNDINNICFAICDIDFFKKINDTHGHLFGDYMLKEFATIATSCLNGVLCRYGGDEFCMLYINNKNAKDELLTFKHRYGSTHFVFGDQECDSTLSIGVYYPKDISELDNLEKCILKADKCLYESKNKGKNKLVVLEEIDGNEEYKVYD